MCLIDSEPDAFGRISKRPYRNSGTIRDHISRDYKEIDCAATGCKWNHERKCAVPSLCIIKDDGGCKGFTLRETPKVLDGD